MSKFCDQCGAENQDNAKFCGSCGSAFGESKRSVESAPIENSIKYESKFTQIKSSFTEFYFSTQGRVGRQEFFFRGFVPLGLLTVFFLFISNVLMAAESQSVQNMNYLVILLAITVGVSQVMISIKRFHDFNASGSWSILLFIPLANIIVLMVLLFKGSINSENKYGDEIGFYEQTPMRWVLFVVQFILIFVLIVFNGFAKYINENKQLQDGKETQSSIAPKENNYEKVVPAPIKEKKLLPMLHNKKWGFIDEDGNWVIKPTYNRVGYFSDGMAVVMFGEMFNNAKYGFIDKNGNLVIQPIYSLVGGFSEGLAMVAFGNHDFKKNGFNDKRKYGFIDKKGNLVIQPIYDHLDSFSEGLAAVKINEKYGFIDKKGNLVIQPIYDGAEPFSDGLAKVEINEKYGFIDKKGNLVIQPIYDGARDFSEGLARVIFGDFMNKKYGFIDKKGNLVIQPVYDIAEPFSEGLAAVEINEKYGFIDKKGNLVIQPVYDRVYYFHEGLARVVIGKKYGFIDKKGNLVIQPVYDEARDFSEGLALVSLNKKGFYINKKGEVAVKPKPVL